MSITLPQVNTTADTFQNWVDKTNAVINAVANSVVTANTNANGATTTGNGFVIGIFGANTLVATTIQGGNVQAAANLTIATNTFFTGSLIALGANLTLNTSSIVIGANMVLSDSLLRYGNTTVNVSLNSASLTIFGSGNSVVNTTGFFYNGAALPTAATRDQVALNGSVIGTAQRINFSGAGSANITATVDAGNNQINVVINSTVSLGNGVGGANTNVLFNDSGTMGGTPAFLFDKSTNTVTITTNLNAGAAVINTTALNIGGTIVNSSVFVTGNSTINTVSNSTVDVFNSPTVTTSYGQGGWNIGANLTANTTALVVGNMVANASTLSGVNLIMSSSATTGNVVILAVGQTTWGNSTINVVANATTLTLGGSGGALVNAMALTIGANLVVNTSSFLLGNSTQSYTGNSSQLQVANATVATIANSNGLAVGSNVSVTYVAVTVGNTVANSTAISSALYTGSGIATPSNYWANTAGKVATTDMLNNAGAYQTLTDAATIAWDMSTGINFKVTLAGNRTLANPSNVVVGRSGVLQVVQDGIGGRTFSFGNQYFFDSDTAPSISTVGNKLNFLSYHCFATNQILITMAAKAV